MSKVVIYRVEDAAGCGPYNCSCPGNERLSWRLMRIDASISDEWPTPQEEGMYMAETLKCAFANLKQLRAWFNHRYIQELRMVGFGVVKYRVPVEYVEYGGKQVVYDPLFAQVVND